MLSLFVYSMEPDSPAADAPRIFGNWTTDQESVATPSAGSPTD